VPIYKRAKKRIPAAEAFSIHKIMDRRVNARQTILFESLIVLEIGLLSAKMKFFDSFRIFCSEISQQQ
jgi:hypothetical protein